MPFATWLAFACASAFVVVVPGPTILTVISYSVAYGRRSALPLVGAVALGDSTALLLSLVGLGGVMAKSELIFTIVKVAGGLYLLYLGLELLRSSLGDQMADANAAAVPETTGKVFLKTYAVSALNPKGIIFFVAFLPQFLDHAADTTEQLWLLSVTFVLLATVNASLYAVFAGAARVRLSTGTARRWFNGIGGCLLTSAGLLALFAKRIS